MKGIIIYGDPIGINSRATYCDYINDAYFEFKQDNSKIITGCLGGEVSEKSKALCSPDDTYDFETGALIALMKMCGRDKVIKACDELYRDDNYKNALQEMTENCEKLMEENEKLQHDYNLCLNSENALKCTVDLLNRSISKLNKAIYGYKEDLYKVAKRCRELETKEDILNKKEETIIKRDEMWEKIFVLHKENDVIIEVKREDVNTFLHEIENKIPEITWASGVKIFETKYTIGDIYEELKTCDTIYFRLSKETKLSYSNDPHIYRYRELEHIDYLHPMRWDLFKKGRIVIGVRKEHYDEFKEEINCQFGIINIHKPYDDFNYSYFIFDKNANFIESVGRSQFRQLKEINNHKIVYWEDVR